MMTEPETTGTIEPSDPQTDLAQAAFEWVEKVLLFITLLMTLGAVGVEVNSVLERQTIELADLLLMFLYTEVIAMIAVFYTGKSQYFVFPIFIAITAIARLIVLQGKDMAPENVLYEAGAILLLAIAVLVIGRLKSI